eukprot:1389056-Prymnesium_polylepis.1
MAAAADAAASASTAEPDLGSWHGDFAGHLSSSTVVRKRDRASGRTRWVAADRLHAHRLLVAAGVRFGSSGSHRAGHRIHCLP